MGLLENALAQYLTFVDRSTHPSTPAASSALMYIKDGALYTKDDAGTEILIIAGATFSWIDDNEQAQEYPGSPGSVDDEFSDGSIAVAWTKVNNPAGGDAWSETAHPGFLYVGLPEQTTTDDFDHLVRIWRTPPAGAATATYVARLAVTIDVDADATDGGEFCGVWVYLGNSTNDEAIGMGLQYNVGTLTFPLITNGLSVSAGSLGGVGTALTQVVPGQMIYVKLVKSTASAYTSSNTYKGYVSGDGIIWHLVFSTAKTFTTACDEFGLCCRLPKSVATAPHGQALIDFVRKTA